MASAPFHTKVGLKGFHFETSMLTMNLDANVTANHVGRAMSLDTSGPNKAKLAGDGDQIIGRLESVEDRKVEGQLIGTVAFQFANEFELKANTTANVGDVAVGGGNGTVKPVALANAVTFPNRIYQVTNGKAVVVKI